VPGNTNLEKLKEIGLNASKVEPCVYTGSIQISQKKYINEILGIQIERDGDTGSIQISQKKYINEIVERFGMSSCKTVSTPLASGIKISKEMEPKTADEIKLMENKPN